MEEQGPSVAVSDDILVSGLPVEIFTEFDVNMDNVVEIDTEGESTGKIVARLKRKAWYLDTRGFILKKIQWHIHAGPWSLVNCWREGSTLPYKGCS